jgi:hypothetical protein
MSTHVERSVGWHYDNHTVNDAIPVFTGSDSLCSIYKTSIEFYLQSAFAREAD